MGLKRTHTIEDAKKIIRELDKKTGKNYAKLPMKTDKRMTRALASTCFGVLRCNGKVVEIEPDSFSFSYFFLNATLTDKDFSDVVIHEYSHLYANEKYTDNCHHDKRYKDTCKELGIPNMGGCYCEDEIGDEIDEAIRLYKLGILK